MRSQPKVVQSSNILYVKRMVSSAVALFITDSIFFTSCTEKPKKSQHFVVLYYRPSAFPIRPSADTIAKFFESIICNQMWFPHSFQNAVHSDVRSSQNPVWIHD